jgi:thiamine monophosphate kinase
LAPTAGEDYELCVCVPPTACGLVSDAGVEVTWIGQVVEGEPEAVFSDARERLSGWEHVL